MNIKQLQTAKDIAIAAAREAGEKLILHFGKIESEAKSKTGFEATDVVTRLDRQTEELLEKRLATLGSNIGFRGEESGVSKKGSTTWLVDPIDGTSHFVRGLPFCTTMIALIEDGVVVVSVIHDFIRNDTYWAIRGQGSFKNDERIQVSNRSLNQAIFSFETRLEDSENYQLYLELSKISGGTISTVNCGFEFAMIACGKIDGRITKNPYGKDWDFAPGSLLVEEAGGVITNHGLETYDYTNHDFIATNKTIHAELTQESESIFPLKI